MIMLFMGIEIGGTKLQVGVGTKEASVVELVQRQVQKDLQGEGIRQALVKMVSEVLDSANCELSDIAGIGIGFGGLVDVKTGVTLKSFQIGGWEHFPLRDWAMRQWDRPIAVQNDANTAGLGEVVHGAGRGYSRVFYMTLGSGVGGGWIVDGQIDDGQGLGAAEIGHMWVPSPQCGQPVEFEEVCSGWSIGRRARDYASSDNSQMSHLAGSVEKIDAKVVYSAAELGDDLANRLLTETCQTLGLGIANVISLLHPERIIIGGGVSLMGPLFWTQLREQIQMCSLPAFVGNVDIVKASLGEAVVVIGAIALAASLDAK